MLKQLVNDSEHISNSRQILSTPEEMIKQEPTLATVKERLYGGVYNNLGTNGDMYEFCRQLRDILIQKYNVQFIFNEEVEDFLVSTTNQKDKQRHITGIVTKTNKTISDIDNVIVANGNYIMPLMEKLNVYIPIYPVKVIIRALKSLTIFNFIEGLCC
jgi:glycine/D-amino acid oxidase-like deaminating enzyme